MSRLHLYIQRTINILVMGLLFLNTVGGISNQSVLAALSQEEEQPMPGKTSTPVVAETNIPSPTETSVPSMTETSLSNPSISPYPSLTEDTSFLETKEATLETTTNDILTLQSQPPTVDNPIKIQTLPEGSISINNMIAAGGDHTCALTASRGIQCWGINGMGQLGDGTTTPSLTPVNVSGLGSGVAAISAGASHTCALTVGGGLKCWGANDFGGPLGDGTQINRLTPVNVSGLSSGVAAFTTGNYFTCALTTGGGVKCWGSNEFGQLGTGTNISQSLVPVNVSGLGSGAAAISAGRESICALTTSGGVKCWGNGMDGQLGNNELGSSNTPVDVIGLDSSIAVIEGGGFHTCALTTEGGIKCWGDNRHGQLGDGTIATRFMPVDVSGLSSGITAITAGLRHTCALTTDGGMKCWGNNEYGQLGDGTTINRSTPVNVSGLSSGVVAISSGWDYTCALITDGGVKCWGKNEYGQLGDGTRTNRSKPTNVIGLSCYGLTLSANSASAGTLTASPVNSSGCVGPWKYKAGKVITFSASPKLYYHFDRWSSTLVNPTTKRMTMPAANIRIVGYFGTNLRQGTYNDTYATGIDHTSTWLTQSSALFYGGTQHYTVTRGSTITINFTGTRLGMYYTQRKTYGRVTIQIDARAAVLLNENALTTGYRKLWWSPVLASGNHKAVITYYAGNPVNTPVNFDGVVVQ